MLGKAIRVSLVKTFIPQCSLLIMDEPFASMDEGRTQKALAATVSYGFSQIVLVTHECTSETLANNIIEL